MKDYDKIYDVNNLYKAFKQVRKASRKKQKTIFAWLNNFSNIYLLSEELKNETYKPGKSNLFKILNRGKIRDAESLLIIDKVVQCCLCNEVLLPRLNKIFIKDNDASLKNKGTSAYRRRFQYHLNYMKNKYGKDFYIVVIDFKKYFDSIDHNLLLDDYKRVIKDERVIRLIKLYLDMNGTDVGYYVGSHLNQISSLLYMDVLDKYAKNVAGLKCYARYTDDIYFMTHTREEAYIIINNLQSICASKNVVMHKNKTKIIKANKAIKVLKEVYFINDDLTIVKSPSSETLQFAKRRINHYLYMYKREYLTKNFIKNSYNPWAINLIKHYKNSKRVYVFLRNITNKLSMNLS